jgi:hypothetical protein
MGSWQAWQVFRIDFASLGHAKHIHAQESRFGVSSRCSRSSRGMIR